MKNKKVDEVNNWKDHWKGMPEFIQEDLSPYLTIKVHFRNQKDVEEFEGLLNQKINKYKLLWFPKAEPRNYANKRYIDES